MTRPTQEMIKTRTKLAIEAYAEIAGVPFEEVAAKALTEEKNGGGPTTNTLMMLMFAAG